MWTSLVFIILAFVPPYAAGLASASGPAPTPALAAPPLRPPPSAAPVCDGSLSVRIALAALAATY